MSLFGLTGKIVVITGANGDIARATAAMLADEGAKLVLTDIDSSALEKFAGTLDTEVLTMAQDVRVEQEAERTAAAAVERFGEIHHLIASAGIYPEAAFTELSLDQWRNTLAVNLGGVFVAGRACVPHMKAGGSIVNVASMAADTGSPRHSDYAASKGGVVSLTRSMARELGPGIRVNALAPGVIDTNLSRGSAIASSARTAEQIPLRRIGRPEEIAGAIVFLCSDLASYITGETLRVNGGYRME